ncbi:hypothetical protein AA309_18400 [Microvirga vignae]|uniref:Uncharacterized protein n=1 Tax=Microvirga vignae TaxID=1225564 RepID=A0A0H1R9G3_9HYPH|nr:hypothetical protein AA309_18400 [Microvirga vignae]
MTFEQVTNRKPTHFDLIDNEIRGLIHSLWCIDFMTEIELLKIDNSHVMNEIKNAKKINTILAYREKRHPFVKLLNERWEKQCTKLL